MWFEKQKHYWGEPEQVHIVHEYIHRNINALWSSVYVAFVTPNVPEYTPSESITTMFVHVH